MNRTLHAAVGIALAIGVVACERSQIATDPAIEPQFGLTSLVPFEGQFPARQIELASVVCDRGVCSLEFAGSGVVNIMGPVTFTNHVVEDYNTVPCYDAPAEMVLTGATGSLTLTDAGGGRCAQAQAAKTSVSSPTAGMLPTGPGSSPVSPEAESLVDRSAALGR